MSAASSRHMGKVAELGCVVCRRILGYGHIHSTGGLVQAEVHHCFDSATRSDFLVVPLCPEHHRGGTGFHGLGERAFNRMYRTDETKLLGMTIEDLAKAKIAA